MNKQGYVGYLYVEDRDRDPHTGLTLVGCAYFPDESLGSACREYVNHPVVGAYGTIGAVNWNDDKSTPLYFERVGRMINGTH